MVIVPLYIFLVIYLFFVFGGAVFFLINIKHLIHTGTLTLSSFAVSVVFIGLTVLILAGSAALLSAVDWHQGLTLWNSAWMGGTFSTLPSL